MAIKLMYITNDVEIARIAEQSGVDWIFIDLEINGKEERQGHLDTVISRHDITDVKKIKSAISNSELLVRVNPIFDGSQKEINTVIDDGADLIMLPFFKTKEEVNKFVNYVNGRVKVMLLLETSEAVENIDSILDVKGIDYIHIGLNDLHLSYKKKFMFELLADGTVERLCNKIKNKGIPYGFGGIAQLKKGRLPAEMILAEHYRLGSSMVILSRSFCRTDNLKDYNYICELFKREINEIRLFENQLNHTNGDVLEANRRDVIRIVNEIIKG